MGNGSLDQGRSRETDAYGLPQPPPGPRRARFSRAQTAGVVLLVLPVLMGLLRLVDERQAIERTQQEGLLLEVRYKTHLRFHTHTVLVVRVQNLGPEAVESVRVRVSSGYLERFDHVSVAPTADGPGQIDLGTLAPGAQRSVKLQMRAAASFFVVGEVGVEVAEVQRLSIPLRTWVWP